MLLSYASLLANFCRACLAAESLACFLLLPKPWTLIVLSMQMNWQVTITVYLDCRSLETTWKVIYRLFEPELVEFSRNVPINPIRQLEEHKSAKATYGTPIIDKNR